MSQLRIENPFPGLRPFETDEYLLFFGREGQSDELLARLGRTRFLAVVGTSGSGKSSLVRAGLLPSLRGGLMRGASSGWRVALLRPGSDPIGNLAVALAGRGVLAEAGGGLEGAEAEAVIEATLRGGSLGLVQAARQARLAEHENLLVVVDQFEELFRFRALSAGAGIADDAAAFVKLLLEAAQQRELPVYVVLTMRSDFLGDCAQFQGLPEAINDGQYLIPRLTRDERRAAIVGPARVARGRVSEQLVNRLLNDVGDNPDQLPILQHALMRTWDYWKTHRRDSGPVEVEHYEAVGTMSDALSLHADEAWDELRDDKQRRIAERMFKALTEKGADNREIRRPTRLAELCAITGATEDEVTAVIDVFRGAGRSFLMPPAETRLDAECVIDISHESLIRNWERLKKWVDEEAQAARVYRRLAETAVLRREGLEGMLTPVALQNALDWQQRTAPNRAWGARYHPEFDLAMQYLEESRAHREAEAEREERQRRDELERERREREQAERYAAEQRRAARRLRALVVGVGVMFLISLATAAYAFTARAAAITAQRDALVARANALLDRDDALNQKANAERAKKTAEDATAEARRQKHEAEEATARAAASEKAARTALNRASASEKAARAALNVAQVEKQRADRKAREALAAEAVAVKQREEIEKSAVANENFREATVLAQRSRYQEAKQRYEEALKGYEELKKDEAVADAHLGIGDAVLTSAYNRFLEEGGDFNAAQHINTNPGSEVADAVKRYRDAAEIYAAGDPRKGADTLFTLGSTLMKFVPEVGSKARPAESALKKGSDPWETEKGQTDGLPGEKFIFGDGVLLGPPSLVGYDPSSVRSELKNKAVAGYQQARDYYFAEVKRYENTKDDERLTTARSGLQDAEREIGKILRGEANEEESKGTPADPAEAAKRLAYVKSMRSNAIEFFEDLLKERQPPETDLQVGRLLIWLAGLHYEVGNEPKAEEYLARVLRVYESANRPPGKARALLAVADVLDTEGQTMAASAYLARSLAEYRKGGEAQGEAEATYRLGRLYEREVKRGWPFFSYEKYEQSLAAYQRVSGPLVVPDMENLFHMGSVWETTGEYQKALDAYRLVARAAAAADGYKEQAARANDEIGSLLALTGQTEEAIEAYNRSLSAYDAIAAGQAYGSIGKDKAGAESRRIRKTVEALTKALNQPPPATRTAPKP